MKDWLRSPLFQMLRMLLLGGELQLGMETTKANPQLLLALVMPERNINLNLVKAEMLLDLVSATTFN